MTRPELTPCTSVNDFDGFYWLKEELAGFCRAHGLPTAGSKQVLNARIRRFLETGQIPSGADRSPAIQATKRATMPAAFTRESVIGEGWRCNQALRAFFEQEIGKSFHFDGVMRGLIHNGAGMTLEEVINVWKAEQKNPIGGKEIAPQFEYNRHMRAYCSAHPAAGMAEAVQAWNEKKQLRRQDGEASDSPG